MLTNLNTGPSCFTGISSDLIGGFIFPSIQSCKNCSKFLLLHSLKKSSNLHLLNPFTKSKIIEVGSFFSALACVKLATRIILFPKSLFISDLQNNIFDLNLLAKDVNVLSRLGVFLLSPSFLNNNIQGKLVEKMTPIKLLQSSYIKGNLFNSNSFFKFSTSIFLISTYGGLSKFL